MTSPPQQAQPYLAQAYGGIHTTIGNARADSDRDAALRVHNTARANIGVRPLRLDWELERRAQMQAEYLASVDDGLQAPYWSGEWGEGENSAVVRKKGNAGRAMEIAAESWAKEKVWWAEGVFEAKDMALYGRYTQMIWHSTTHVGVAAAKADSGRTYVVARYWPSGNVRGREPYPGSSKLRDVCDAVNGTKVRWRQVLKKVFG